MTDVLGRKYVLFDPEQTEYLNRKVRDEDCKQRILVSASTFLEALDDYVQIYESSMRLDSNVRELIRRIEHISCCEFHDDYQNKSFEDLIGSLKWKQ